MADVDLHKPVEFSEVIPVFSGWGIDSLWLLIRCIWLLSGIHLGFLEDTLKKEKHGVSSSYAADSYLKSEGNGKSQSFWPTPCLCRHKFFVLSVPATSLAPPATGDSSPVLFTIPAISFQIPTEYISPYLLLPVDSLLLHCRFILWLNALICAPKRTHSVVM